MGILPALIYGAIGAAITIILAIVILLRLIYVEVKKHRKN